MEDPLPVGLGLRVPPPSTTAPPIAQVQQVDAFGRPYVPSPAVVEQPVAPLTIGPDGLCEFDELSLAQVCQPSHLYDGELKLNYADHSRCAVALLDLSIPCLR